MEDPNPLLSVHKSSDSGLQALLHPLVLLTVSDYITRHQLRQQEGPIVGALLGQQHGRDISLEHAFECKTVKIDGELVFHEAWFEDRLQQFKDVHKAPPLDLVGWFTHTPPSGPQAHHLAIHRRLLERNESAILLAFHPSLLGSSSTSGGKLPITIYESVYEAESHDKTEKAMEAGIPVDTELKLRFKVMPYSVETGQAEMIGIDFVAKGGGNATAVEGTKTVVEDPTTGSQGGDKGKGVAIRKGKEKVSTSPANGEGAANGKVQEELEVLNPEDEELVASLTAKANAIKMLHARIRLLNTYLASLPHSYLTGDEAEDTSRSKTAEVDHTILRSIQALVNRLPLIIPADRAAYEREILSEKNDVSLVALLGSLSRSIKDVREVGRKFSIVDTHREFSSRRGGGLPGELFGSFGGVMASPTGDSQSQKMKPYFL